MKDFCLWAFGQTDKVLSAIEGVSEFSVIFYINKNLPSSKDDTYLGFRGNDFNISITEYGIFIYIILYNKDKQTKI